jgi:hypothetical protein
MTKTPEAEEPTANFTLTFRKNHPKGRCSYGVAGAPGIAVFDMRLFANGKAPKTITVDAKLTVAKTAPIAKGKK